MPESRPRTRYIFVTGGVVSSLGKGIAAASIGRLLVSRGRVIAAMARHAAGWITNVKQGGRPRPVVPDKDMKDLAVRATEAVAAEFAGVDILHDRDGHPTVLEVNSMPAWSGLQKVTRASIARILAGDLVDALAARTERGATA